MAELYLDGEAEALARRAVELAMQGDAAALRLCLDRTIAPRRERAPAVALPRLRSGADIAPAVAAIADAVSRGAITAAQAAELAQMLNVFVRAIEASEFEDRLRALERDHATQH